MLTTILGAVLALALAAGIGTVINKVRDSGPTIPAGIHTLAALFEQDWAPRLAQLAASGVPTAAYNNVISRGDAQALIPEDVANVMLGNLNTESLALGMFTRIPVAQSQTRLPILSALPVAYWVNGDTGLKQTTEVNWANRFLNIEELAAIVPIPENVLDDSTFDVWGSVRPLLENAIARAFDAAVLFGVSAPASFPASLATAAAAAGNTVTRGTAAAAAGGIVGDFSSLYTTLEDDGYDPDVLAARTTYKGRLRNARDTTGEGFDDDFYKELRDNIIYPARGLWPAPATGAVEALVAQKDNFVVGVRKDFTYKILDQAVIQDNTGAIIYNLAQQDMVALRVTFRAGWQVANTINYDQPVEASRYPAGVMVSP